MTHYDILIKDGTVVDGSGSPKFKADVGVRNGKISFLGKVTGADASRVVDAKGMFVAPGFVDIHAHSDISLVIDPKAENRISEGITTDTGGNCGGSPAPITEKYKETSRYKRAGDELAKAGLKVDWATMGEYFQRLEKERISVNIVTFVGFGTIRGDVIGSEDRPPTSSELEKMKSLTAQAMEEGAFGLSTGLTYLPGYYAHTDEIVEVAKVAARYGGMYTSHIREWGSKILGWPAGEGSVVEAVAEAVEIGRRSGVRAVQISHMGTKWPMWGKEATMFQIMEEGQKEGVNVAADIFPHELASLQKLSHLLPLWAGKDGKEELLKRLRDPKIRAEISKGVTNPEEWSKMGRQIPFYSVRGKWDKITLYPPFKRHLRNRDLEGKTVQQAASELGKDPVDFMIDTILSEEDEVFQTSQSMNEDLRKEQIKHHLMMVGSDGSAMSIDGPQSDKYVNPRVYGTYARMLGRWVREQNVLTWEEMIHKMTSMPATALGLWDRGLIRPGMNCDIVIFDPHRVIDKATFAEPHQYSEGMKHVFVNGELVLDNGRHTGARPGKVLRNRWQRE